MPVVIEREGEAGAINTNTEITTDYDRATPGAALPLADRIVEVIYALGLTADTADDVGTVGMEFGGDGIKATPVRSRYPLGGTGLEATAGGHTTGFAGRFPVAVPANKGEGGVRFGVLVGGSDVLFASAAIAAVWPS